MKKLLSSTTTKWEVKNELVECDKINYAMVFLGTDCTINLEVQQDFGSVYDFQQASYSFTIDEHP
jgi:hypothetical protein